MADKALIFADIVLAAMQQKIIIVLNGKLICPLICHGMFMSFQLYL